ncbi:MAG: hypothetical protein CVV64_16700 [Candidatus Wallbacteria bacterium HGW-Wallbacteria-1]|jgi:hypothetical protein|uniref:Uncharacterized protein n=1 Tax=Candidatus Wallbacteria bacterium HGW-Wallbacteria-1 TaxID=2013854 RepID=A0A2N1PKK0_9BACT|nr:MAG: hypothetical protein CVV64_16700 [Candidatus Wallbacteria bacterium HGW-Wallbacteria-1]
MNRRIKIIIVFLFLIVVPYISIADENINNKYDSYYNILIEIEHIYKIPMNFESFAANPIPVNLMSEKINFNYNSQISLNDNLLKLSKNQQIFLWKEIHGSVVIINNSNANKLTNGLDFIVDNVDFKGSVSQLTGYIEKHLKEMKLCFVQNKSKDPLETVKFSVSGSNLSLRQILTLACNKAGYSWRIVNNGGPISAIMFRELCF